MRRGYNRYVHIQANHSCTCLLYQTFFASLQLITKCVCVCLFRWCRRKRPTTTDVCSVFVLCPKTYTWCCRRIPLPLCTSTCRWIVHWFQLVVKCINHQFFNKDLLLFSTSFNPTRKGRFLPIPHTGLYTVCVCLSGSERCAAGTICNRDEVQHRFTTGCAAHPGEISELRTVTKDKFEDYHVSRTHTDTLKIKSYCTLVNWKNKLWNIFLTERFFFILCK